MKTDDEGYVTLEVRNGVHVRGTIRRKPKAGRLIIARKGAGLRRQFRVTVSGKSLVVRDQDSRPWVNTCYPIHDLTKGGELL